MKKRAQNPDAHTYTIIFNGCAEYKHSPQALSKVISIYHSMLTDKSKVKPNTIHMNAVLKMCARAGDMDALAAIAGDMPTKGIRAANNLTYTTVFNAIRFNSLDAMKTLSPMQLRRTNEAAILEARQMWEDITERWRKADIWIDEELVSSMGRILLLGKEEDADDVLSLIEQAMDIPRQFPRLATQQRQIGPTEGTQALHPPDTVAEAQLGAQNAELAQNKKGVSNPDTTIQPGIPFEHPEMESSEPKSFIQSITPPSPPRKGVSAYAKPGRNSLLLVLQALDKLGNKDAAGKYWKIFTRDLRVKPDAANYHAYLRILRVSRSSTETMQVLFLMPPQDMGVRTFRIAMATCVRDKLNAHAFMNAGKILDLMRVAMKEPDLAVLLDYLELSITATPARQKVSSTQPLSANTNKLAQAHQIMRALDRLDPFFLDLKSSLYFSDPTPPNQRKEFLATMLSLVKRMVSAYDILMNQAMVPREMYGELTKKRSILAAFITRHKEVNRRKSGPLRKEQNSPSKENAAGEDAPEGKSTYYPPPKDLSEQPTPRAAPEEKPASKIRRGGQAWGRSVGAILAKSMALKEEDIRIREALFAAKNEPNYYQ
jgi:hypothetical protein